jgi:hypothetical protein
MLWYKKASEFLEFSDVIVSPKGENYVIGVEDQPEKHLS